MLVSRLFPCITAYLLFGLLGCTPNQPPEEPPRPGRSVETDTSAQSQIDSTPAESEPGDTTSTSFDGTAGIVEKEAQGGGVSTLQDVRTARHDTFDRVVFAFGGDALPGYHIEYVDKPVRACGSGNPVPVAGEGWLEVRMIPARAHTEEGTLTVSERERQLDYPNLRELEVTCDFEADVTWVLGLTSPNRYRVIELSNPSRLVIDVQH